MMLSARITSVFPAVFLICCCGCAQLWTASAHRDVRSPMAMLEDGAVVRANDGATASCGQCLGGGICEEGCVHCSSQIEFGQANRFIDGVGWFFGIPSKILLWDHRAENHHVSQHTAAVAHEYVESAGLDDVKVRINQYAPGDEWRRLTQNKAVSPLWRYSFGALSTIGYTLLPGRLFGGDHYNPYTNTVSIYSDIPSVAVHEAAYARDNANHHYRGTYGFGQYVAGINIWHETQATQLAYEWMQQSQPPELVAESSRVLPPLYGMRVGESIGQLFPPGDGLFTIAGAVTGHAVGFRKSRNSNDGIAEVSGRSRVVTASHDDRQEATAFE